MVPEGDQENKRVCHSDSREPAASDSLGLEPHGPVCFITSIKHDM